MEIKVGDIKYFTLLRLNQQLSSRDFAKLDLKFFDSLQAEVGIKILQIENEAKNRKVNQQEVNKVKRRFDFWCQCMVHHHPKETFGFYICPVCDKRTHKRS